jgi:hypothetical protein
MDNPPHVLTRSHSKKSEQCRIKAKNIEVALYGAAMPFAERLFKEMIDKLDTNLKTSDVECIELYKEFCRCLFYMRRMNPQWNIQEESREDFSLQILVDILRLCIEKVKTLSLDETDWRGCSLVHKTLKSVRAINPEWSINGSKRVTRTNK